MLKKRFFCILLFSFIQISAQDISLVSWNIRDFGKTKSTATIEKIATMVKQYDIVAIQEVVAIDPGGAKAVARLVEELNRKGAKWDYVISNQTNSPPYKTERYAFLWKTSKVKTKRRGRLLKELSHSVYREPFEVVFMQKGKAFKVLNYHSRKHNDKPEEEIAILNNYVIKQKIPTILVGDFNLAETDKVFNVLYENNFRTALNTQKTTLKRKCKAGRYLYHSIDNIYLSKKEFLVRKTGIIDFVKHCNNLAKARLISDHVPVTIIFSIKKN